MRVTRLAVLAALVPLAMLIGVAFGGAAIALAGIFVPGLLLQLAALSYWWTLRTRPHLTAAFRGVNAAVVGILAAALYRPIWTGAVFTVTDDFPSPWSALVNVIVRGGEADE